MTTIIQWTLVFPFVKIVQELLRTDFSSKGSLMFCKENVKNDFFPFQ